MYHSDKDLLTTTQAAAILNFDPRYVRNLLNDEKLKGFKLPTGSWRVPKAEVERWLTPFADQHNPDLQVTISQGKDVYLVVTNSSSAGNFSAHVCFEEQGEVPYVVPWLESKEANLNIAPGGCGTLKVATYGYRGWLPPSPNENQLHWIRFFRYASERLLHVDKGHWSPESGKNQTPDPIIALVTMVTDLPTGAPYSVRYAFQLDVSKGIINVTNAY